MKNLRSAALHRMATRRGGARRSPKAQKSLYNSVLRIITPPLSKPCKDSTGQRAKIHKSAQYHLYQISPLHFKRNLCKIIVAATVFHLRAHAGTCRWRGQGEQGENASGSRTGRPMCLPSGRPRRVAPNRFGFKRPKTMFFDDTGK